MDMIRDLPGAGLALEGMLQGREGNMASRYYTSLIARLDEMR